MFFRNNIYTVHERANLAEPTARIVLVREGFSFWAFLFTFLWLFTHRLWLLGALYVTFLVLLVKTAAIGHLADPLVSCILLGVNLWLGLSAHDAERAALERNGYALKGVVAGGSELLAQQRYYDHQAA